MSTASSALYAVTVIRVGTPDVPYVVAVVAQNGTLRTGRLIVDPDAVPPIGTLVTPLPDDEHQPFVSYRIVEQP